ncbi:MAG: glycosyltransferase, partial [Flavobacteriales bacterium]|nr:glycosyltransferase [Flavobacteriales bacterium]
MDRAEGEYIIRVDADDILLPHRFKEQIAFMDAHPEIGISGTNIKILGRNEVIKRPTHPNDCKVQLLFVCRCYATNEYLSSILIAGT